MTLTFSQTFLAFLLFTFFIVAGITALTSVHTTVTTFATEPEFESFNQTFNQYTAMQSQGESLKVQITNPDKNFFEKTWDFVSGLFNAGWHTLGALFGTWTFIGTILNGVGGLFGNLGVPSWAGGMALLAIGVSLAFAALSAFLNKGEL